MDRDEQKVTTSAWDESGMSELTASGDSVEDLLQAALTGLLRVICPENPVSDAGGKTLRIRGEGKDAASVLFEMSRALLEQIDDMAVVPVSAVVDGLVHSERGLIGWASVIVLPRDQAATESMSVGDVTSQGLAPDAFSVRLRLQRTVPPTP